MANPISKKKLIQGRKYSAKFKFEKFPTMVPAGSVRDTISDSY